MLLAEQLLNNTAVDVCQPEVPTRMSIGQSFVVKPHDVQDRGMKIVNVHGVLFDAISDVVRLAIHDPRLDSSSGQPA